MILYVTESSPQLVRLRRTVPVSPLLWFDQTPAIFFGLAARKVTFFFFL